VKGNELLALLALADIANDEGVVTYAKPEQANQRALAEKARMSVATFRRQTDALQEHGLLEVSRDHPMGVNRYRLLLGAQFERSALTGERSSAHSYERSERSTVSDRRDVVDVQDHVAARAARGTRMTTSWTLSPEGLAWTREHAPSIDVESELANFRDYWVAIPGQRGVKLDWDATWRNNARRRHESFVRAGWKPQLLAPEGAEWMAR